MLSEQHPDAEEDSDDADAKAAGFCPSIVDGADECEDISSSGGSDIDLENEKFVCFDSEIPWSSSAS